MQRTYHGLVITRVPLSSHSAFAVSASVSAMKHHVTCPAYLQIQYQKATNLSCSPDHEAIPEASEWLVSNGTAESDGLFDSLFPSRLSPSLCDGGCDHGLARGTTFLAIVHPLTSSGSGTIESRLQQLTRPCCLHVVSTPSPRGQRFPVMAHSAHMGTMEPHLQSITRPTRLPDNVLSPS